MESHRRVPGRSLRHPALFAVGLTLVACGPAYTVRVLDATQLVEQARVAGAETSAPYPYYTAVAYLEHAREEAGQAEYQHALDACDVAHASAEQALEVARRQRRTGDR